MTLTQRKARRGFSSSVLLALMAFATAAVPAQADEYKMLGCSSTARDPFYTIENNTPHSGNPAGIFNFWNGCGGEGGDPPGNSAFLRIEENQANGRANNGAKLAFNFDTPNQFIHFRSAGAYTRQPESFNDGWRSRLLISGGSAGDRELVSQGWGQCNCGTQWGTTSTFAPHLWPFGGYLDFTRVTWEMVCMSYADCDRTGVNIADLNGMVFILSDEYRSAVNLLGLDQPFMAGSWVRGQQVVGFNWTELGSGMKLEQVKVDGAVHNEINHNCDVGWTGTNGEFARVYQPCDTAADIKRYFPLETGALSDGAHTVSACTRDYAQWTAGDGSSGESCDSRVVHTDNSAPGAPNGLHVITPDTARYWDTFNAQFTLPANAGSPITRIHYRVIDGSGAVVVPEQVATGVNPTELKGISGPKAPGDYRLQVWLEDLVGFSGPASSTPLPRDTTPPAAPQNIAVTAPAAARSADGFDVRWQNIVDAGAPIDRVHYQVVNDAGTVVVPTETVNGANVQSIPNLTAPAERGSYSLRMWLSDAEGNAGAPAVAPLAYTCVRSDSAGDKLSSGLGPQVRNDQIVKQGEGSTMTGALSGPDGKIRNAPVCIYSRVSTDSDRSFEGLAMTNSDGDYRFPVSAGPSRDFTAVYRSGHREVSSTARVQTIVKPTFRAQKKVVKNKRFARFFGEIPGPHNDQVVVVLQVKSGKGWLAFRRYRTRNGGKFMLAYRFNRTTRPTKYIMRAQVRQTTGYPYLQGNSRSLPLKVVPK